MRSIVWLCSFLSLFLSAVTLFAGEPPAFVLKWGTLGSGDGEFDFPRRLAVTLDGTVFVSDRNNSRVQKFTSTGGFIAKWGSLGSGDGQFDFPFGIAVDLDGNVYVAERNNNRIQKFTGDGTFVTKWGEPGAGDGQFNFPIAVDTDAQGNVYVGDSFNHRIQKFTSSGQFLAKWGSFGSGSGQFNNPIGLAVDKTRGFVYVGDASNNRVQKFTTGGAFLAAWGTEGTGDGDFRSPRGLGVDLEGRVYVSDTINNRIQVFTSTGELVTKWGEFGTGDGQFNRPEDAEVDGDGNIYVADPGNNRVQKFAFQTVPVTLLFLTAERSGPSVLVRWEVSSPAVEDAAFHVYRQEAGGPDVRMTPSPLAGRRTYEYRDVAAPAVRTDYWLVEITKDGREYPHGPVTVAALAAAALRLERPSPNPFNPATRLVFFLPRAGRVRLDVFDVRGVRVSTLVDEHRQAGEHTVSWNGRGSRGDALPSGTYFLRLEFEREVQSAPAVLLK